MLNINHFDANRFVVAIVAPIVDAMGRVERQNVTIADCLLEILRLYRLCLDVTILVSSGDTCSR